PSAQPQPAAPEPKPPNPAAEPNKDSEDAASQSDEDAPEDEEPSDDEPDKTDEPAPKLPVEMSPEIDAGFVELAQARIARDPLRYYLIVPLKRASSMWFDTHAQYYPFEGELFPLSALDTDLHQQYW